MVQRLPLAPLGQENRILDFWMASNATAILFSPKKECKSLLMISMEVTVLSFLLFWLLRTTVQESHYSCMCTESRFTTSKVFSAVRFRI